MAGSNSNKQKLLVLLQILEQKTDENHPISVQELIHELAKHNITAERKSIYEGIETLLFFGYDIVVQKGRKNQYYLGQRTFQIAELRLLVDAVQSSQFITHKKSRELTQKISSLASDWQKSELLRQVHIIGRPKTENESIYYNIDTLHTCILNNQQIQFLYYTWTIDPKSRTLFSKQWRKNKTPYCVSPWSMLWNDDNYYLVAFDEQANKIKHYRVDKMANITPLETPRLGNELFETIDLASYSSKVFGMFGGVETTLKLRFANRFIGIIIDRFGEECMVRQLDSENFTITISAVVSPQFISWLLGFGQEAEVLEPASVREQVRLQLEQILHLYD